MLALLNLVAILLVCASFLVPTASGEETFAQNCPRRGRGCQSAFTSHPVDAFSSNRQQRQQQGRRRQRVASSSSSPLYSSEDGSISSIRARNSAGGTEGWSRPGDHRRNRRLGRDASTSLGLFSDPRRQHRLNRRRLSTPRNACNCPPGWLLSPLAPVLGTTCTSFYTLPSTACSSLGQYSVLTCQRSPVNILPLCKIGKLLGNTCSDTPGSQPVQRNGEWRCVKYAKVPDAQLPNVVGVCPRGSFPQCMIVTKVIV